MNIDELTHKDIVAIATNVALELISDEKTVAQIQAMRTIGMEMINWVALYRTVIATIANMPPDDIANIREMITVIEEESAKIESSTLQQPVE